MKRAKQRVGRWLALSPRLEGVVRLAQRRWRGPRSALPDWSRLIGADAERWEAARADASRGPRVLIATSVGAHLPGAILESVLAAGLTLRGAAVEVLLCDGLLPACLDCTYKWFPDPGRFAESGPQPKLCSSCFAPAARMFGSLGIPVHRYSDFLLPEERREAARLAAETPCDRIPELREDGMAVGEHALAGALRYFARAELEGEPAGERVLRRFLDGAIVAAYVARRLLGERRYDVAVFHHGIYVPQGSIGEAARRLGVRVVNWNPAYRQQCFIFSHGDTYHHTLMDEDTSVWEQLRWTPELESRLLGYLRSRWYGTDDWIWFHDRPRVDLSRIAREVGIDYRKPTIGLLTNVAWDAQLHYPANVFRNMHDWLRRTIEYFAGREDLQLLVRIHPAEIRGGLPARQRAMDELRRAFPRLPPNVSVIPPESRISTYAAMEPCNAVIIYGTKTGVELACTGTPVIVAGEAWVRHKGFTLDAASEADYLRILDTLPLPGRLTASQVERARRYGFHFFFRRMVPVRSIVRTMDWLPYRAEIDGLSLLEPGGCPGLDVIARGILEGTPFIYPAEDEARVPAAG